MKNQTRALSQCNKAPMSTKAGKAPNARSGRSHAGKLPVSYLKSWMGGASGFLMAPGGSKDDGVAESLETGDKGED